MLLRRLLTGLGLVGLLVAGPVALAAPYPPPSTGSGYASPSRVAAGECVTFGGDGFAPVTSIAIADDGAGRPAARSDASGAFATKVCFDSGAKRGRHTLTGTGQSGGTSTPTAAAFLLRPAYAAGTRVVTAYVVVTGVAQSDHGQGNGNGHGRKGTTSGGSGQAATYNSALPRTGLQAIAFGALGTGLLGLGAAILLITERRHRRRRAAAPS